MRGDGCGWIQLATGRKFRVPAFSPDEITIEDVAHALSMQCRYAGHCLRFLSVAEHCVHLWRCAPAHVKYPALMHDSSESVLSDIPRSIKDLMPEYRALEDRIMHMMAKKWCFEWPMHPIVRELDSRILLDERAQNMPKFLLPGQPFSAPAGYSYVEEEADGWPFQLEPLGIKLEFWSPHEAEMRFLEAFNVSAPASVR